MSGERHYLAVELENVQYISPPRHPLVAISLAFARLIRRHPSNNTVCNVPGSKTFPTRVIGFSNLESIGEISRQVYQPPEDGASFHVQYSTIPCSTVSLTHSRSCRLWIACQFQNHSRQNISCPYDIIALGSLRFLTFTNCKDSSAEQKPVGGRCRYSRP